MSTYQVVEKFVSINGEGRRAGELAALSGLRAAIFSAAIVIPAGQMSRDVRVKG